MNYRLSRIFPSFLPSSEGFEKFASRALGWSWMPWFDATASVLVSFWNGKNVLL